jgi:hypothetical protein
VFESVSLLGARGRSSTFTYARKFPSDVVGQLRVVEISRQIHGRKALVPCVTTPHYPHPPPPPPPLPSPTPTPTDPHKTRTYTHIHTHTHTHTHTSTHAYTCEYAYNGNSQRSCVRPHARLLAANLFVEGERIELVSIAQDLLDNALVSAACDACVVAVSDASTNNITDITSDKSKHLS